MADDVILELGLFATLALSGIGVAFVLFFVADEIVG